MKSGSERSFLAFFLFGMFIAGLLGHPSLAGEEDKGDLGGNGGP